MVFSAKKIELIERYYNEDLSPEELDFFMEQMVKDSNFAEEVKQFSFVFEGIDELRSLEMKNKFNIYERQYLADSKRSRFVKFTRKSASMAAAFSILLMSTAYLFVFTNPSVNTAEVYAQYFEAYPNVIAPVTRSLNQDLGAVFLAMNKYDSNNYTDAITAFDDLLDHNPLQNEILFYKAVSLMSTGKHKEAKVQLELMDEYGQFKNQRKWYLALASLQLEEFAETQELLTSIVQDQSSYSVYAQELLSEFFSNK